MKLVAWYRVAHTDTPSAAVGAHLVCVGVNAELTESKCGNVPMEGVEGGSVAGEKARKQKKGLYG